MGVRSKINKMKKYEKLVEKYAAKRAQLKKEGDYAALAKLPRASSKTRLMRLCALTGRSHAVYRKFKISRIMLRELALEGKIPGMRKASW